MKVMLNFQRLCDHEWWKEHEVDYERLHEKVCPFTRVLIAIYCLKVPLQSQNMLVGFISEWEMLLCPQQSSISLEAIMPVMLEESGSRMATTSQLEFDAVALQHVT